MSEDFDFQAYREAWWQKKCPKLFIETEIEKLPERSQKSLENALKCDLSLGIGLLLYGPSRTGKTRVAWQCVRNWAIRLTDQEFVSKSGQVKVFDALEFGSQAAAAFRSGSERDFISSLVACEILLIDDLGKSKITERGGEALFHVIDRRSQRKKSTIITTNLVGDSLEKRFEDRETAVALIARLREFCESIALTPNLIQNS